MITNKNTHNYPKRKLILITCLGRLLFLEHCAFNNVGLQHNFRSNAVLNPNTACMNIANYHCALNQLVVLTNANKLSLDRYFTKMQLWWVSWTSQSSLNINSLNLCFSVFCRLTACKQFRTQALCLCLTVHYYMGIILYKF